MNMKSISSNKKKQTMMKPMRGFMCQSPAATAVCVSDSRAVMVPTSRRPAASHVQYMRRSSTAGSIHDHDHAHTRSLINNRHYYSRLLNSTSTSTIPTPHHHQPIMIGQKKTSSSADSVKPSSSADNVFQVVVMRVSIHCQGCAGKVKKHLSKMEGVTSFSIDLEAKMVTVRGHVSPVGVLESISKVKKAELLPS